MTEQPPSPQGSKQPEFYSVIAEAVHKLQSGVAGAQDSSVTRANLARLRAAAGRTSEQDPLAWSIVLEHILPDFRWAGKGDSPSQAESAAYTALTLYALHQRSLNKPMHVANNSLGYAVAQVAKETESKSVKGRLDALVTASTQRAINYHLRSLISLLNAHEVPLDYGRLAQDLWSLQQPQRRDGVILRWSRDFANGMWVKNSSSIPSTTNS